MNKFLPPMAFEHLFGTQSGPSVVEAAAKFATRKVSMFPVYVISTNDESLENLVDFLQTMPTQVYMLQAKDFDIEAYDGIGVDRVANLRGAEHRYGNPAIVIDAGTALTWTCSEVEKAGEIKLRGGGIAPGLAMKFKAMNAFTGKLPDLGYNEVMERLKKCTEDKKPLLLFARDTKDAMISAVIRETAFLVCHIIRNWTKDVLSSKGKAGKQGVPIVLTGGDSQLIVNLISGDRGHMIQKDKDALTYPQEAKIFHHGNVVHDGFASVLLSKTMAKKDLSNDELGRINCVGQRVIVDREGTMLRGSIVNVDRGEKVKDDKFTVNCEDHSVTTLSGDEICGKQKRQRQVAV